MLDMKDLTVMNNERLINMFLWRLWAGWPRETQAAAAAAASYPVIGSTEQGTDTLWSPISDINHTRESEITLEKT